MFRSILLVGIGGALGCCLRYLTTIFFTKWIAQSFPWATFVANIAGCLLIGLLMGCFSRMELNNTDVKLLLVTGFCGGYTTFSAFAFENFTLIQQGNYAMALLYILISVFIGIAAVMSGFAMAR